MSVDSAVPARVAPAFVSYRKRPVVVEAHRWTGDNWPDFLLFIIARGGDVFMDPRSSDLIIETLEGQMRATVGDWIIRGVEGEFYPCKPGIFEQTYEPVSDGV